MVAGGEGGEIGQGIALQNVDNLIREIKQPQLEIDKATRAIGGGAGKIALLDVAAATDKATAATQRYDETIYRLQKRSASARKCSSCHAVPRSRGGAAAVTGRKSRSAGWRR